MARLRCTNGTIGRLPRVAANKAHSPLKNAASPVTKSRVYNRTHCPTDLRPHLVSGGDKRGLTGLATSSPAGQAGTAAGELRFIPAVICGPIPVPSQPPGWTSIALTNPKPELCLRTDGRPSRPGWHAFDERG